VSLRAVLPEKSSSLNLDFLPQAGTEKQLFLEMMDASRGGSIGNTKSHVIPVVGGVPLLLNSSGGL